MHSGCAPAAEKDRGFDRAIFSQMLGQFSKWPRADFNLTDAEYEQLKREVKDSAAGRDPRPA